METWEKIPAWHLTKVRNKNEVIDAARNEGRKVQAPCVRGISFLIERQW